jgi:hypothetical protein
VAHAAARALPLLPQVPGAQHTSCTVEMVPFHERLDVAVVDEVRGGGCRALACMQHHSRLRHQWYYGSPDALLPCCPTALLLPSNIHPSTQLHLPQTLPCCPAPHPHTHQIQMIGDEQRGWAWTRALLGLPASEIHVAGDLSAIALVRQLAQACGDEFEVQQYDRWVGLVVGHVWWCGCVGCQHECTCHGSLFPAALLHCQPSPPLAAPLSTPLPPPPRPPQVHPPGSAGPQ